MPFEPFLPPIEGVNRFLETLVTWPRIVGNAIACGQSSFPKPQNS